MQLNSLKEAPKRVENQPFPTGIRIVCSPAEAEPALASCLSWLAGMVRSVWGEAEPAEWIFSIPADTTMLITLIPNSYHLVSHSLLSCTCLGCSCSDSAHQRPTGAAFSRAPHRAALGHAHHWNVAVAFGCSSCWTRRPLRRSGGAPAALHKRRYCHLRQAAAGCSAGALGSADDGSLVGSYQERVVLRCRLPSVSRLQGDTRWTVRRYTWSCSLRYVSNHSQGSVEAAVLVEGITFHIHHITNVIKKGRKKSVRFLWMQNSLLEINI